MADEVDEPKPPYPRPPIVEAVIAVHFPTALPIKWIETFAKKLEKSYPLVEDLNTMTANFDAVTNTLASSSSRGIGKRIFSFDRSRAIVLLENQLSICRLAPYLKWEDLCADAIRSWEVLKKIGMHIKVSHASTRYINRIDIPAKNNMSIELDEYFKLGLSLPYGFSLNNFYVNYDLSRPKEQLRCTIQFLVSPPILIDHLSIMLDIDCVSTGPAFPADTAMWERISKLRQQKNEVFEDCITMNTLRLFQ
jgi:uncharacterized protein (TIGR04255 family)